VPSASCRGQSAASAETTPENAATAALASISFHFDRSTIFVIALDVAL